jgi:hypothetical protein
MSTFYELEKSLPRPQQPSDCCRSWRIFSKDMVRLSPVGMSFYAPNVEVSLSTLETQSFKKKILMKVVMIVEL